MSVYKPSRPLSLSVPQLCPGTLSVVDDRSGGLSPQGGERGLQRCPSSLSTKAQSVGTYAGIKNLSVTETLRILSPH